MRLISVDHVTEVAFFQFFFGGVKPSFWVSCVGFCLRNCFSAVIPASLWCWAPGEAYLWPSALSVPPFNR